MCLNLHIPLALYLKIHSWKILFVTELIYKKHCTFHTQYDFYLRIQLNFYP